MWFKIVTVVWFVATVFVTFILCCPTKIRQGFFMDTSEQNVAKIRSGMTLAEVERIIGGPPGYYTFSEDVRFRSVSGEISFARPNTIDWTTYRGTITIFDGQYTLDGSSPEGMRKPAGIVDSVTWQPFVRVPGRNDPWPNIGLRVGCCVFVSVFLYGIFYRRFRGKSTTVLPPTAPHHAGGASASDSP